MSDEKVYQCGCGQTDPEKFRRRRHRICRECEAAAAKARRKERPYRGDANRVNEPRLDEFMGRIQANLILATRMHWR